MREAIAIEGHEMSVSKVLLNLAVRELRVEAHLPAAPVPTADDLDLTKRGIARQCPVPLHLHRADTLQSQPILVDDPDATGVAARVNQGRDARLRFGTATGSTAVFRARRSPRREFDTGG